MTTTVNHSTATLPARLRVPGVTLALAALMLVLQYAASNHSSYYFDQAAIWHGELWRLLTGHFVHADNAHLRWNVVALLVLGFMLEQHSSKAMLVAVLAGAFAIDLWLLSPLAAISRYCGLSGILNGVLVLLLWQEWQHSKQPLLLLTGVLALAKIIVELLAQQSLFTHFSWPPYPPAHLCGFVAGLLALVAMQYRSEFKASSSP